MTKKTIYAIVILLAIVLNVNAQKLEKRIIDPFTYGSRVESINGKFKNMFKNIPKFIDNSNEIKFLGYNEIGTINNVEDAFKFLSKMFYVGGYTIGFHTQVITNSKNNNLNSLKVKAVITHIGGDSTKYSHEELLLYKKKLKNRNKKIANQVKIGDEVYQINYVLKGRKMRYYVFVNTKTKQVMTKGNIFAKMPVAVSSSH